MGFVGDGMDVMDELKSQRRWPSQQLIWIYILQYLFRQDNFRAPGLRECDFVSCLSVFACILCNSCEICLCAFDQYGALCSYLICTLLGTRSFRWRHIFVVDLGPWPWHPGWAHREAEGLNKHILPYVKLGRNTERNFSVLWQPLRCQMFYESAFISNKFP